jgi:site-specific DNA recombinase
MIDAATTKPPPFGVILVHSFSRFFRDQFQLEFYVRRLAKNGARLVSVIQELGDEPTRSRSWKWLASPTRLSRIGSQASGRAMRQSVRRPAYATRTGICCRIRETER